MWRSVEPRPPPRVNRCATATFEAPIKPFLSFQPVGVSYRSTAKADVWGFSEEVNNLLAAPGPPRRHGQTEKRHRRAKSAGFQPT